MIVTVCYKVDTWAKAGGVLIANLERPGRQWWLRMWESHLFLFGKMMAVNYNNIVGGYITMCFFGYCHCHHLSLCIVVTAGIISIVKNTFQMI